MNDVERVDREELNVSRREVMAGTSVVAGAAVLGAMPRKVEAQDGPTMEISGTVTDQSGAVEGATVVAVPHDESLDPLVTTTDANGEYLFDNGDLYEDSNLYHVIARDGTEADPRRGQENYPFIAATGGPAIPDSGVARYEFEQNVEDSWNDNDATDNTSAGYVSGEVGTYAKDFDGTDDYVAFPFTFDSSQDFSVLGWAHWDSVGANEHIVGARDSFSTTDWVFRYNGGNTRWELAIGESFAETYNDSYTVSAGDTIHWAVTKGGNDWTVYIDASSVISATTSQGWTTSDTITMGAAESGTTDQLDGWTDHTEFHGAELTASEVQNHMNTGSIE